MKRYIPLVLLGLGWLLWSGYTVLVVMAMRDDPDMPGSVWGWLIALLLIAIGHIILMVSAFDVAKSIDKSRKMRRAPDKVKPKRKGRKERERLEQGYLEFQRGVIAGTLGFIDKLEDENGNLNMYRRVNVAYSGEKPHFDYAKIPPHRLLDLAYEAAHKAKRIERERVDKSLGNVLR